jgi:hypothetical protein
MTRNTKGKAMTIKETITLTDAVELAEEAIADLSGLWTHWEYSRSGAEPLSDRAPSNSRYFHVRGGNGEFVLRVSDHHNVRSRTDSELLEGMTPDQAETIVAEFAHMCSSLTAYDEEAHQQELEAEWRQEADEAMVEHSAGDLIAEFKGYIETSWDYEQLEQKVAANNEDIILLGSEEDTFATWTKGVLTHIEVLVDVGEMLPYFNALKLMAYNGDDPILGARADYGNMAAAEEKERRRFVPEYLRKKYYWDEDIPTRSYAIEEWMTGWIEDAISDICGDCKDQYPELFPGQKVGHGEK